MDDALFFIFIFTINTIIECMYVNTMFCKIARSQLLWKKFVDNNFKDVQLDIESYYEKYKTFHKLSKIIDINVPLDKIEIIIKVVDRQIPTEICYLANLKTIDYCINEKFTYTRNKLIIPIELFKLKYLCNVCFDRCNISYIPSEIGQLNNLKYLSLWNNSIKILPTEIGLLFNLADLILVSNKIEIIPTELGNLSNLSTLNLSSNPIRTLPSQLGRLKKLKIFFMFYNTLNFVPKEIMDLQVLIK
jgi:hypothetical protein